MERLPPLLQGCSCWQGLCEIGGGYLVWGWMREHKPLAWAVLGALILATYGVVAALQPISEFGELIRRLRRDFHRAGITVGDLWWTGSGPTGGTCWELGSVSSGVVVMLAPPRG